MLKVLHTGDWHIGSFPGPEVGGQNARFQDICRCLDFQAMYAEEHRPDLIVVSGDIFHQARVWSDRVSLGKQFRRQNPPLPFCSVIFFCLQWCFPFWGLR